MYFPFIYIVFKDIHDLVYVNLYDSCVFSNLKEVGTWDLL